MVSNPRKSSKSSAGFDTSERDQMLEAIKADFDQRLADLASQPQQWIEFLEQVAVFGARYSMGNQLMLMVQCAQRNVTPRFFLPFGAKDGSTGWRSHGRHIKAGEKAFYVWAPVSRRPTEEQAKQWEAAGRKVQRDAKGRPVVQVVGFRPSATFELSQTDGTPFEPPTVQRLRRIRAAGGQQPQLLTGQDTTEAFDDIITLIKDEGYSFDLASPGSPYLGSANGVTVKAPGIQLVRVRDDVDPAQQVKTSVHELGHIRCGHLDATSAWEDLHSGRRETEAESVAHIVCAALGLDTSAYSDAYVLSWADGDLKLIQDCGETIVKVARKILTDLTPADPSPSPDLAEGAESAAQACGELVGVAG